MKHTRLVLASLLALLGASAHAQYKVVGPDGTITFTDRVPDANNGRVSNVTRGGTDAPSVALPFELQQAAQKYPVTIYTSADCAPCRQGRELLVRRGIPFNERTANTPADKALWEKATGSSEAPVLMVGKQQMRGFNATNWGDILDAAGYPATSKLPTNYRLAEATPLAGREAPRAAAPAPVAEAPSTSSTPSGPGGIRF